MSFARLIERAWEEHRLFSVLLELTYRCNLDCSFCYNDLGLAGRPLARHQHLALLDELAELGVLNLILSGGEPLAHPDFFTLGARARALGFLVRVKSNGHALRGAIARRMRDEVDPFVIEISLHGATADVHDRQTRVPGSFERLLANLDELAELGLRVKLNSTLTAWNEHQLEAMVALAEGLEIPLQIDPEVTARDDGDRAPLALRASGAAVERLLRLQAASAGLSVGREGDALLPPVPAAPLAEADAADSAPRKHCGAGAATVAIDPLGNVYPCVQWRRPVGNLHRQTLAEIWSGSPALAEVRRVNERVEEAVAEWGPAGRRIGFCPGAAELATGEPTALYPAAAAKLGLHRKAAGERPRELLPVLS